MSDHKYGEPVPETDRVTDATAGESATSADDAVASAHEGLAHAEAAQREVSAHDQPVESALPSRP
jgi:hypothetical protein